MQRWLKITIGIISSLIIILLISGFLIYRILTSSLPDYSGSIKTSGLRNNVSIYRDSMAIPYIIAGTDEDAYFALGYVHAQDRLFTMDLVRRAGQGRLSEIIGTETVPFDKMFRTIGIERTAQKILAQTDAKTLGILKAYSNGVNEYIKQARGKYPVEFDILRYDPEEWSPLDCIIVSRMMAWELNISWWVKFSFLNLIQKFGYDAVKDILPSYQENGPAIISTLYNQPGILKTGFDAGSGFMKTDIAFRNFMGWKGTHIGSNSWVVNGNMSVSGKPVIANDTHLALSAPCRWYFSVIKTNSIDVAGFTLPGAPGIIIGENKNIAWVLTNIMEDDADFYSEKIDSSGLNYFYNGNWNKLDIKKEIIKVKDSQSINLQIKSTKHGPIVSGIHPYSYYDKSENNNQAVISMSWLGNYVSNEIPVFLKLDKAVDWNEFSDALQEFSVPGQNFIYADKSGNIGYLFGAKLPVRESNLPQLIYDGTTDKFNWKEFLPANETPRLLNPAKNYIASANNKTVENFKYYISNMWEPSSRIERITQLLSSKPKHSVEDFMRYQSDFVSPYAEKITGYIINAFKNYKSSDPGLKAAIKILSNWDYNMDQYSQAGAVYSQFYKYLLKNIFYNKMGAALYNEYVLVQNIPYRAVMELFEKPQSTWFDDPATTLKEGRDDAIRKSMENALEELRQKYGEDPAHWQWGSMHKVLFKHSFSGISSILDRMVNIGPFEIGGDGTTIFNTEYPFTDNENLPSQLKHNEFENSLGPVMRYIYDFSVPDEINMVLTTGESGNIMSSHYSDITNLWLNGRYLKIKTDINSIRNNRNKLLILSAY